MEKDSLNTLFDNLKNEFDIAEPKVGHEDRFLSKLNKTQIQNDSSPKVRTLWRPWIGAAASIALLVAIFIGYQSTSSQGRELASISPEMANTEAFFTNTISTELAKLKVEENPEFQELIVDALFQIEMLEQNFEQLKIDLDESGEDKRVIYAMISNYQNRIDILENVLQSIEELKQNEINNENSSTL